MADAKHLPIPASAALRKVGGDLRDARRRRRLSVEDMAARMFVSRDTVWRMEKGDPAVGCGSLASAMFILGMVDRLAKLADQTYDSVGLDLDRESLPQRIRRRRTKP